MAPGDSPASPSPPRPPPEPAQPSTPGTRAARLQQVFAGALSSSLQANSYANFSACFPTPAAYCPAALKGVWRQLNQRLEAECRRDFDKILQERGVVDGLNQWDALLADARRRRDQSTERDEGGGGSGSGSSSSIPMHSLSADQLYTANVSPVLRQAHGQLEAKWQESQRHNQAALTTIQQQQREIELLMAQLEAVVHDLEGSVEAMTTAATTTTTGDGGGGESNTTQALKTDVWAMHQEITHTVKAASDGGAGQAGRAVSEPRVG